MEKNDLSYMASGSLEEAIVHFLAAYPTLATTAYLHRLNYYYY